MSDWIKEWIGRKFLPLQHHGDCIAGNRHRGRKPRGLDADEVDCTRSDIVNDLYFEILNLAVFIDPFGKDAAVSADVVAAAHMRPYFDSFLVEVVEIALLYSVVGEVVGVLGGRTEQDISVRGDGDMDTHVCVGRDRVDRHWDEMTESSVQDDVVILGADDAISGETEHVGNLTASKAGGIDDPAGPELSLHCRDYPNAVSFSTYVRHLIIEEVFGTVVGCVFSKRYSEHKRIQNAAVL